MNNPDSPQDKRWTTPDAQPDRRAAVRVGDHDRAVAMEQLGQHFAAGRLTITEYDQRCAEASKALIHDDLSRLFVDLPQIDGQAVDVTRSAIAPESDGVFYSAAEVAEAHQQGRNPRLAVMLLVTIASMGGAVTLTPLWESASVLLLLIPTVAVLLYVLKVGPDSWHRPSPRTLERQRARRERQLLRQEIQQRKTQRQLQVEELKTNSVNYVHRFMGGTDR